METQQFNRLFSLPLEIRQHIYLLASPPRIVRLQEQFDEDWEDFLEEIYTVPGRLNLDPSLTHFAFNWCVRITAGRQRQLESFGFTTNKARRHPWPPSASTPEIPCGWLEERPAIAWELARKSHFYSNAAIPPLLHVSRKVRAEMMSLGYRLFFRTRSSQPRTWFNVNHDVLFAQNLGQAWSSHHEFLSGCDWDFGQFDPDEMKLVRKLALENGTLYFDITRPESALRNITTVLRLFPGLGELLLLGWIEENRHTGKRLLPGPNEAKWAMHDKQSLEPWVISTAQEIDCLFALFPPETTWRTGTWAGGSHGEVLTAYLKEHGHDAPYLVDAGHGMQRRMAEFMEKMLSENPNAPQVRWSIPRFTAAQALPVSWVERQQEERQSLRQILRGLQQEWELAKESQADSDRYFPEGPGSDSKFASVHCAGMASHDCSYCETDCGQWTCFLETQRWWIEEGPRM